jgi:polyhydroxyalkanoate synthesis regulator phasin
MIYKKTTEERLSILEEENIANTNEIYRIANIIDFLERRIKQLEDLVVGDGK